VPSLAAHDIIAYLAMQTPLIGIESLKSAASLLRNRDLIVTPADRHALGGF
jgi:hypothetical protein